MSAHIAQALKEIGGGDLYIVDDFSLPGSNAAIVHNHLTMLGLTEGVYIMQGKSTEVEFATSIDFAFIDGDHSLAGVSHDFDLAAKLGAKCIVIHDTVSWWGPRNFTEKNIEGFSKIEFPYDEGLAVYMKTFTKPPVSYSEAEFGTGVIA